MRSLLPKTSNGFIVLCGILMLTGLMCLAWIGSPKPSVAVGEKMTMLDLQPLVNTSEPMTNARLEGNITLLFFWRPDNADCQKQLIGLTKLGNKLKQEPLVRIVTVASTAEAETDLPALTASVTTMLEESEIDSLPVFSDSVALTRTRLAQILPSGSFGYPTYILVGTNGVIVEAIEGGSRKAENAFEILERQIRLQL